MRQKTCGGEGNSGEKETLRVSLFSPLILDNGVTDRGKEMMVRVEERKKWEK